LKPSKWSKWRKTTKAKSKQRSKNKSEKSDKLKAIKLGKSESLLLQKKVTAVKCAPPRRSWVKWKSIFG